MESAVITNRQRVIVFWLLLIVCMILHFDYHVSQLFYGIDVKVKDANGTEPASILVIRSLFHFLPLLYISLVMWSGSKAVRVINLVLSVLYCISHLSHLTGELKKADNPSQMILLSVTVVLAGMLVVASFLWNRKGV